MKQSIKVLQMRNHLCKSVEKQKEGVSNLKDSARLKEQSKKSMQ